jgi:glycosyltransferase involved in cell wall biosynthesis
MLCTRPVINNKYLKDSQAKELLVKDEHRRPRIALVTNEDAADKRSWSCSLYYIGKTLQEYCGDVTYINPLPYPEPPLMNKILAKSALTLIKKRYLHECNLALARHKAQIISQKLAQEDFTVIIAVASETAITYLQTDIPIIFISDATYAQLVNFLPYYSRLLKRSIHETQVAEELAFKKTKAFIMSSEWASQSVIEDCHVSPEQVFTVPFGVNFDESPSFEIAENRKLSNPCKLLFTAVEWERKGGAIAFETLLKLEESGIEAELIVCGCVPPGQLSHPHLKVIPYLDKNDTRQHAELEQLYITSDFLLLPTRADCAPNVFREANAFGLPVITTNTGGIASIITNNENGFMLPLEARGTEYAELIAGIYNDEERYGKMVKASRKAFEERLNWDAWGKAVRDILWEAGIVRNEYQQQPLTNRVSRR